MQSLARDSGALPVAAKYIYGALILYALTAGVVAAMHPSSSEIDIILDGLLWPGSVLGFVWDYMVSMYGRMFT